MQKESDKNQKIIKTGNSAALTIPSNFFKALNLQIGDQVQTLLDYYEGSITYKFVDVRQLRLGEASLGEGKASLVDNCLEKGKKNVKNTKL